MTDFVSYTSYIRTNIDIESARGNVCASGITNGGVSTSRGSTRQSANTNGRVCTAGIIGQRLISNGGVEVAAVIVKKRQATSRRILNAIEIFTERMRPVCGIIATVTICQCAETGSSVVKTAAVNRQRVTPDVAGALHVLLPAAGGIYAGKGQEIDDAETLWIPIVGRQRW